VTPYSHNLPVPVDPCPTSQTNFFAPAESYHFHPPEAAMLIGAPKEIKDNEHRVGLTPASVAELTRHGHAVLAEKSRASDRASATTNTSRPARRWPIRRRKSTSAPK
jgi:hypothetical protein